MANLGAWSKNSRKRQFQMRHDHVPIRAPLLWRTRGITAMTGAIFGDTISLRSSLADGACPAALLSHRLSRAGLAVRIGSRTGCAAQRMSGEGERAAARHAGRFS